MRVAIISCFETYQNRIDDMEEYYKSKKFDVTIIKSNFLHFDKKKINEAVKKNNILIKVPKYKRNISLKRMISHFSFSTKVVKYLKNNNYDLIHVLVPPNSLCKQLSKLNNDTIQVIYDVIDYWPETMPIQKIANSLPYRKWQSMRDKSIVNADYVLTECNLFEIQLKKTTDIKKVKTVYFTRKKRLDILNLNKDNQKIEFVYLGSINNIIDIELIVRILVCINEQKPVILHIIGDGEKKIGFIKDLEKNRIPFIDHGKIYNMDEKKRIFENCSFGFNIMKKDVFVGLTMKSIDYFQLGLPIINNISHDTVNLVEKYDVGINIDNYAKIQDKVNDIINKSQEFENKKLRKNVVSMFDKEFSFDILNEKMDMIMEDLSK